MPMITDWRFCRKCNALFFNGDSSSRGVCPVDKGSHDPQNSFNFMLPHALQETPTAQAHWRQCRKCMVMYFLDPNNPNEQSGPCPSDGHRHAANSLNFVLPHDLPETPTAQAQWNFCNKCHVMFYNGFPSKGRCPRDSQQHVGQGDLFVLPHDLPPTLDFQFGSITLPDGVPVGGNASVTLRQDGSYTFSGHLHDSGAVEFNTSVVFAIKDSQNRVYTKGRQGHVSGTFESGLSDDDWTVDSTDTSIADNWPYLAAGSTAVVNTAVNLDLVNLTNEAIGTLGTVLGIVALL